MQHSTLSNSLVMLHDYRFNVLLATNAETSDASSTWLIRVKSFVTVRMAYQNRTYPLREYRKCRVSCNRLFYHNYQFPESYILEHHVGHRKQQPLANAFCRSGQIALHWSMPHYHAAYFLARILSRMGYWIVPPSDNRPTRRFWLQRSCWCRGGR